MSDTKAKCGNGECDWTGDINDVTDIRDFWDRVQPGEEMPAGECPKCGWLAYVVKSTEELPRVIVIVSGGLVTSIRSDAPLNVDVADFDNIETGYGDEDPEEEARILALEAEAERLPHDCF